MRIEADHCMTLSLFDDESDRSVASCQLSEATADAFYMYGLRVSPEHQNKGYGRALVKACIATAAENGKHLLIEARPFSVEAKMSQGELESWYAKQGFKAGPILSGRQMLVHECGDNSNPGDDFAP